MLSTTKKAIMAILQTDITVSREQVRVIIKSLDNDGVETDDRPINKVLNRHEVAEILGVSAKRVDQLCQSGALRRITVQGTKKAIGISAESVRELTTN